MNSDEEILEESDDPQDTASNSARLPIRPAEQRLLEIGQGLPGNRIVCTSVGRGQAAESLAAQRPEASVTCWFLDGFRAGLAQAQFDANTRAKIVCSSDWPGTDGPCREDILEREVSEAACELALIPLPLRGEAELTRDMMQAAYANLVMGGHLVVAVDNPKDTWVHDQMKTFDKSVKVRPFDDANVYFVQKQKPIKRVRDFTCELSFKDSDNVIRLVTRPGVFSHRQLDNGARQILDAVDIFPDARILDIGCGSGSIGLALAAREPTARVTSIDSHARAVWCTEQGARMNELSNIVAKLNYDGMIGEPEQFDMVVANPPYYSDYRIAQQFIETATRSLRREGRLVLVTKQPKWYEENLGRWLKDGEVFQSRRYFIASGVKP